MIVFSPTIIISGILCGAPVAQPKQTEAPSIGHVCMQV